MQYLFSKRISGIGSTTIHGDGRVGTDCVSSGSSVLHCDGSGGKRSREVSTQSGTPSLHVYVLKDRVHTLRRVLCQWFLCKQRLQGKFQLLAFLNRREECISELWLDWPAA